MTARRERHKGDTLTPKQKEWMHRVRLASAERPKNKSAGAIYLGVSLDTLHKWVWFFTGSGKWPAKISSRFDLMPIVELTKEERQARVATRAECRQLQDQVRDWLERTQLPLCELARLAFISDVQITSLMQQCEMSLHAATALARSFRGNKIWYRALLSDAEIEARKTAVEQERRERERRLLEEERIKYGLTRQFKPLSQMLV